MTDTDVVRTIRRGQLMDGEPFNPQKVALLSNGGMKAEGFVAPAKELKVENFSGTAKVVALENTSVKIESESSTDGFLVLSDLFYPGWKATVDGQPQEIVRSDYVLRGLPLKPGKHAVEFRYEPTYLLSGGCISILGLLMLLGVGFKALKSGAKPSESVSETQPEPEPETA
jgi:hypothetical protein